MSNDVQTIDKPEALAHFLLHASEGARCIFEFPLSKADSDGKAAMPLPSIVLPCRNVLCSGSGYIHDALSRLQVYADRNYNGHSLLQYRCRHCGVDVHMFALLVRGEHCLVGLFDDEDSAQHHITKFGQVPPRGGPLSSAILSIADKQSKELLRKGLESERHSLGIAAFAYYRRALERMHTDILNDIREIVPTEKQRKIIDKSLIQRGLIRKFDLASKAIPESLKAGTSNPLLLLNDCLNCGLHDGPSDSECLEMAHNMILCLENLLTGIRDIKRFVRQAAENNQVLTQFRANQKKARVLQQQPSTDEPKGSPESEGDELTP